MSNGEGGSKGMSSRISFVMGLVVGAGVLLIFHAFMMKSMSAEYARTKGLEEENRGIHRLLSSIKVDMDTLSAKIEKLEKTNAPEAK